MARSKGASRKSRGRAASPETPGSKAQGKGSFALDATDLTFSVREIDALEYLAQKQIWDEGFESDRVRVWELERLHARGWIQKVGSLAPEPDWPEILTTYSRLARGADERLRVRVAVTDAGRAALDQIRSKSPPLISPIEELAQALERVSAEWRYGDCEMLDFLAAGHTPESGSFEKLAGPQEGLRASIARLVDDVRLRLLPATARMLESQMLSELRDLAKKLDPRKPGPDRYGEVLERWRHQWVALDCEDWVREVVAHLRQQDLEDATEKDRIADSAATSAVARGMSFHVARERIEKLVMDRGGELPNDTHLAQEIGCSRPTVRKAIRNSRYLRAREAERNRNRKPREKNLTEKNPEQASRSRDAVLKGLIAEQAKDMEREDRQAKAAKRRRR